MSLVLNTLKSLSYCPLSAGMSSSLPATATRQDLATACNVQHFSIEQFGGPTSMIHAMII